jgi:hypothetical protein
MAVWRSGSFVKCAGSISGASKGLLDPSFTLPLELGDKLIVAIVIKFPFEGWGYSVLANPSFRTNSKCGEFGPGESSTTPGWDQMGSSEGKRKNPIN